jgi:hypothetical protein
VLPPTHGNITLSRNLSESASAAKWPQQL